MARWVFEVPNPAPWVVSTLIAGWGPTTYDAVGIMEYLGATGRDGLKELTRSLPGAAPRDEYIIQVFKCDRHGRPKTHDPYYEHEYQTLQEAVEAHREAVRLLAKGKLPLKRVRRNLA